MMRYRVLAGLAWVSALSGLESRADAAYLGLATQLHTVVNVGGTLRAGYRVYAVFSDPNDYLTSVSGSPTGGPMVLQSLNSDGSGPGANFFDSMSGTPGDLATNASSAAIGQFMSSDSLFITGNSYFNDNIAWFTLGPQEQGRAGGPNGVSLVFNGAPALGVMTMQLAVPLGDHVAGTFNVGVSQNGVGSTIFNQSFSSIIPAPNALGVLLLTVTITFGKRRRCSDAAP